MIFLGIFAAFFKLVDVILDLIPTIDFVMPNDIFSGLSTLFYGVGYFLPVSQLLPILIFSIIFSTGKIGMEIVLRVKSFIPTMGH